MGPADYSRARQLDEIEKQISKPDAFDGMKYQRVTEALVAAKLSRNMEKPRFETDGRFQRAIRFAAADGLYRQKLEALYEHIWTAFWWFDDFNFLKDSYYAFEEMALKAEHAKNLEFLCNLLQLLFNSILHGHMSREECQLDQRIASIKKVLEPMAINQERPNNALEAQTSLLVIRLNEARLNSNVANLTDIFREFSTVVEKAEGLGEFDVDRLLRMVEVMGQLAGNDPAYNNFFEKIAEFASKRKGEAEGALIRLKRAQSLDFSDNFEMIRLLGRAAIGLAKKEYSNHLIEALQLLTLAYRSAGLLWAARASCIFLAASLVVQGEEENELPISFVPTMKIWAWLALELRHLPDFLFAIQMLNGAAAMLPLTEESKAKVQQDIFELGMALGSKFLNTDEAELRKLEKIPDILEALGLSMPRIALLYSLGYIDALRSDGSLPSSETDEGVNHLFSSLASQPIANQLHGLFTLNTESEQTLSTSILGMTIEITVTGSTPSILVAEVVLGSLEAFFATTLEQRISPHTEKLHITVVESDAVVDTRTA